MLELLVKFSYNLKINNEPLFIFGCHAYSKISRTFAFLRMSQLFFKKITEASMGLHGTH